MKKLTALLLAVVMLLGVLTGCGQQTESTQTTENTVPSDDAAAANRYTFPTLKPPTIRYPEETTEPEQTQQLDPVQLEQLSTVSNVNAVSHQNLKYVMIYNPSIVSDYATYIPTRTTGSFGNQINPYANRSESLDSNELTTVTPEELMGDLPVDQANKDGDRAGGYMPVYQVGNTRNFYCYTANSLNDPRIVRNFSCRYVGEHCYIWVHNGCISDSYAKYYGQEFDNNIYEQEAEAFGEPRFADRGGKIHLLYYPMPDEFAGCFCRLDLYASYEYSQQVVEQYGLNTDHAIIHMNGPYSANANARFSATVTMGHELQHLICASDDFYTADWRYCPAWFNEAMSGYVETLLYPDYSQSKYNYVRLHNDYLIRHGQSMYSFNYVTPDNQFDFSVYDSVYLYASYLARLAGEDVFSNFHDYWRYSGSSSLYSMEAIANAVDQQTFNAVFNSIDYGSFWMDQEKEFMSKLTLQFYLDMLDRDATDPEAFAAVQPTMLVYDERNAANIQPGGRVIVAVNGNSYYIPNDASSGLMYIGLDENFKPVTNIIYR